MKKFILLAFCGLFLIAPATLSAPRPVRIDVNHSNIGFAVPIAGGLSKVRGKFSDFTMDLQYDEKDITRSSVQVAIATKSIDTGIDQRDEHLRTADFFDVVKFPEITFQSRKLVSTRGVVTVFGDLTMRGVTRRISFRLIRTGRQYNQKENEVTLGFSANLTLDRRDFGIKYRHETVPGFIGNVIEIELNIITRANKMSAAK